MRFLSPHRILGLSLCLGVISTLGLVLPGAAEAGSKNNKRALGKFAGTYKGAWYAAGTLPVTLRMPKGKGNGTGTFEATPCNPADSVSPLKLRITRYKVRRNGKKLISTGRATWKRADVPALIGPNLSGKLKVVALRQGNRTSARGNMRTGRLGGRLKVNKGGSLPNAVCAERSFSVTGVPIRLLDNDTTTATITVPNSVGVVTDLDVSISIVTVPGEAPPFNRDYDVKLRHIPSGVEIELFTDIGWDDDGMVVRLDDDAAMDIGEVPDSEPDDLPVTGIYRPEDTSSDIDPAEFRLAAFNGVLASGKWQLIVTDDNSGLFADLLTFTLHIK